MRLSLALSRVAFFQEGTRIDAGRKGQILIQFDGELFTIRVSVHAKAGV